MRAFLFFALFLAGASLLLAQVVHTRGPLAGVGETERSAVGGGVESARPVYTITDLRTYEVTGRTEDEILASLRANGPRSGDRSFFGLTETEMEFRYWKVPSETGCALERIRLDLHVVFTLPRWEPGRETPYALRRDWARFESALRRHEDQHRAIAERNARAVYHALRDLRAPSCEAIDERARQLAERIRADGEREQYAFDRRTRHGGTQGALWPPSSR